MTARARLRSPTPAVVVDLSAKRRVQRGAVSRCNICCRSVTHAEWSTLRVVGLMDNGAGVTLELANHGCGSTISRPLEPWPDGDPPLRDAPWQVIATAIGAGILAMMLGLIALDRCGGLPISPAGVQEVRP